MKISVNPKFLIALFLVLNLALMGFVVFLFLENAKNRILDISDSTKSYTLPFLKEDIEKIHVASRAFVIYDPQARVVILGKNEKLRFSPASTAKIMTASLVLEEYDLRSVLVAKDVREAKGSKMHLEEGESITVENLLYGMMLPSGNDAALVLAKNYLPAGRQGNGGVGGFVQRMNEKAKELSLSNTKFYDPAGFEDENYTTAYDLARLAAYALKNPKFGEIVSAKNKIVTDTSGKITHELHNLNELLGTNGVNGVKTGFTGEAGGVLVSSVALDGKNYIIVVLNSSDRFGDTKNIIMEALKKVTLISY